MTPQDPKPFNPEQPNDDRTTDPPAETNLPSPQASGMAADVPVVESEPDKEPPTTPDNTSYSNVHVNPNEAVNMQGVTQAVTPIARSPKRGKRALLIIGLIVGIVVILLGGAYAAFALWYNNPKKVATDVAYGLLVSKTMVSDGKLSLTQGTEDGDWKVDLSFATKINNPDVTGQVDAMLTLSGPQDVNFEMSGAGMLTKSGALYFKFDRVAKAVEQLLNEENVKPFVDASPNLKTSIDAFVKKIDGTWIKVDEDYIKQFAEDFRYNEAKQCYQKAYDEFMKDKAQQKQLIDVYQQHEFLQLTGQGMEVLNNTWVNKYALTTDLAKAYDAMSAYEKTDFAKKTAECGKHLSSTETEATKKPTEDELRDQQQELDKAKITLYVATIGHELKRVNVNYDDNDKKLSTNSQINLTQNQPVDVADPEKSIPLKEFQADIERLQQEISEAFMTAMMQQAQEEQTTGSQIAS